jgi:hypothetical protein
VHYSCLTGDLSRPPATLSIIVNDLSIFMGRVSVYGEDYISLIPHSGLRLVTANDDDLPFTILSRKGFLEQVKATLNKNKEMLVASVEAKDIDSAVRYIDGMLRRLSSATLGAPAVVPAKATEFEGFADGEEGAVQLIQLKNGWTRALSKKC